MSRNSTGFQLDRPIRQSLGSGRRRHSATDSVPKRRGTSQSIQRPAGPKDAKRNSKPSSQSFLKDVHSLPDDYWDTGMPRWRRRIVFNCSRKYLSHAQFETCTCPRAKLQLVSKAIRTGLRVTAMQCCVIDIWKDAAKRRKETDDIAEALAKDLYIGRCPEVLLNRFKEVHRELVALENELCMRAKISSIKETISVKLMSLEELRAKADAHREEFRILRLQLNEQLHSSNTLLEKTTKDLSYVYRSLQKWADEKTFNEMSDIQRKSVGNTVEHCLYELGILRNTLTIIEAIADDECDSDSGGRSVCYQKLDCGEPLLPGVKESVPGMGGMAMYGIGMERLQPVQSSTQELDEDVCGLTSPAGDECVQPLQCNTQELDEDACGLTSPVGDECVQPVQSNTHELDEDLCRLTSPFGEEYLQPVQSNTHELDEGACNLTSVVEEEGLQEHSTLANQGGSEEQSKQGDDDEQHELFRLCDDQLHSNSDILSVIRPFSDNDGPIAMSRISSRMHAEAHDFEKNSYANQSDELRAPSNTSSINQSEELRQNTGQSEIVQGGTGSKDAQQVFAVVKPTRPKPRYNRSHENCGQHSKYSLENLSEREKQILASIVGEDYAPLHSESSRPPELRKQAIEPSFASERTQYGIKANLQQKPCCPSKGQAQAFQPVASAGLKPGALMWCKATEVTLPALLVENRRGSMVAQAKSPEPEEAMDPTLQKSRRTGSKKDSEIMNHWNLAVLVGRRKPFQ